MRGGGGTGVLIRGVTLVLVLLLTVGISFSLPMFLGPDEPGVLHYANFVRLEGRLPDPRTEDVFQAQHPPLYHVYLALGIHPGLGAEHTLGRTFLGCRARGHAAGHPRLPGG